MTKTLTEQWREGTLPEDCYYILDKNGHIRKDRTCFYSHTDEQCFCFTSNKDIEEVLAPVPSYDDCNELKQDNKYLKSGIETRDKQIEQLEKRLEVSEKEHYRTLEQLRIATVALKETKEKLLHVELSGLDGDNRQKMYDLMFEDGVIDKALKEMKDVK